MRERRAELAATRFRPATLHDLRAEATAGWQVAEATAADAEVEIPSDLTTAASEALEGLVDTTTDEALGLYEDDSISTLWECVRRVEELVRVGSAEVERRRQVKEQLDARVSRELRRREARHPAPTMPDRRSPGYRQAWLRNYDWWDRRERWEWEARRSVVADLGRPRRVVPAGASRPRVRRPRSRHRARAPARPRREEEPHEVVAAVAA